MTNKKKTYDYTASARSAARYARAADTIKSVTLNAEHAAMLKALLERTGENRSDFVRRAIREQAAFIPVAPLI